MLCLSHHSNALITAHRGETVYFRGWQGNGHGYLVAVLTITHFTLLLGYPMANELLVFKVGSNGNFIQ